MSYKLTEENKEETIPAGTTTLIVKVHIVPKLTFTTPRNSYNMSNLNHLFFIDKKSFHFSTNSAPATCRLTY